MGIGWMIHPEGSSTLNRGKQQKLGFLPHLMYAAQKLGRKPVEMGHLNVGKPSFLVDHDLVRCYHPER
jgi:hypothetical protein